MLDDPQTPLVPADPSWWRQYRAPLRLTVRPSPQSNGSSDNRLVPDGIDDWIVPGAVPASGDYPDDWIVPGPTPANGGPAAVGAQSGAARNDFSDPLAAPSANSIAARPDPFASYFSLIPAAQIGAMAWHPPIFPTADPFSPANLPASAWLTAPPIFPNSLGQFPSTATAPLSVPRIDPTRSLLGAIPDLQATNPAAFPFFQRAGLASGDGNQFAPLSLLQNLANLAWSHPPTVSGGVSNAGDGYAVETNRAEQFPLLDNAPFGAPPFNTSPALTPPPPNPQPANPAALPLLQRTEPTSGDGDQSVRQSPLQNLSGLGQPAPSDGSGDVDDNSASSASAAFPTRSNESRAITRVVRDSTGRALAIIYVQPAPSNAPPPEGVDDATPEALRPGARYAQINNAVTNNPVIDRTTDMLLAVLQESVLAMGAGSGARFGTAVHVDFANRVRKLDLPGIGQKGVEQGFHLDIKDFIRYGLDGSIRTDVTLRDPKDPYQRPIAVYDLKTGNAVLTPGRIEEIRNKVNTPGLLIIELQYRTGDAIDRTRSAPRR